MTNSDRIHGEQIQRQLGFRLDEWLCAEEAHVYKPNREFWHVSAYADYDLTVANDLGLTTVFVRRPHARSGPASRLVRDLAELAASLS